MSWRACWAVAVACLAGAGCDVLSAPPRNLVIVSLDTVRRDHLDLYGYARPTAPRLRQLGESAVVFEHAFAQETNTNPSHASMFTGVYPDIHGGVQNGFRIGSNQVTLAEILREAGFQTGGFVSAAPLQRKYSGLERGFAAYDDDFRGLSRDGNVTVQRAVDWLRGRPPGSRSFLFLHLYDAHGPYRAPPSYAALFHSRRRGPLLALEQVAEYQRIPDERGRRRSEVSWYVDRYDRAIRRADDLMGRLLDELDLRDTIVVVLADHGESLGERFWKMDHGAEVFDEQTRIPLVIRAPGLEARRVDALVETVDLLPTLLELLQLELPATRPVQGRSLVPLLRGERAAEPRAVSFSSARAEERRHADRRYRLDPQRRIYAVRSSGWKLIQYPGVAGDYFELYDLVHDPGETRNLAAEEPARVRSYQAVLEQWRPRGLPVAAPELDPEFRERLRALGYLAP